MRTFEDIEKLADHNPVVAICLKAIKNGHISKTQGLIEIISHLADHIEVLEKIQANTPAPAPIDASAAPVLQYPSANPDEPAEAQDPPEPITAPTEIDHSHVIHIHPPDEITRDRIKMLDESPAKKKTALALVNSLSKKVFALVFVSFFIVGVLSSYWFFNMYTQKAYVCLDLDRNINCQKTKRIPMLDFLLKKYF